MAFKPKQQSGGNGGGGDFVTVAPKDGSRYARISLIVDLGTQAREDFEDQKTGETKAQKPCQQVVVFADLVNDVVDYGGNIGKAQYRMLLNKTFQGKIEGVNFTTTPPKDGNGNLVQGKPWTFHPANLLTKLANATGNKDICIDDKKPRSLDIELLLDEPFLCNVEVKKTESKDKKDKDGNAVIYTNVNFKGASPVPPGPNDEPQEVKPLTQPARIVTFDEAKKEDIKFIRPGILKTIKTALNYAGSAMQAAVEAYEADQGGDEAGDEGGEEEAAAPAPAPKPPAKKTTTKPKPTAKPAEDEDVPF